MKNGNGAAMPIPARGSTSLDFSDLLPRLRAAEQQMVDDLRTLVECESPSEDLDLTSRCADLVAEMFTSRCPVTTEVHDVDGRRHLVLRGGGPTQVLLVGHCDTVWPAGTLARWPFSVAGDQATGPGTFDMKAGIVQMLHAMAMLAQHSDLTGVTALITVDEELGSPTSRALIEEQARGARAALVLEASAAGAVKTVRKGVALYELEIIGRAAHAGLEPHLGVNATIEAAHQVLAIAEIADAAAETTVTPTVMRSGGTTNTVPATATIAVDIRATSNAELERVDAAMRALTPVLDGAQLALTGGINRPPLDAAASADLFTVASTLSEQIGIGSLREVAVGGASDGNFTAGIGVPTLDGLGAVGDHAHAEGEWVSVSAMPERAALLAALIDAIRHTTLRNDV